jgi:hypothetical protein
MLHDNVYKLMPENTGRTVKDVANKSAAGVCWDMVLKLKSTLVASGGSASSRLSSTLAV